MGGMKPGFPRLLFSQAEKFQKWHIGGMDFGPALGGMKDELRQREPGWLSRKKIAANGSRAFSLLELILTVVVIGLLAALVFPAVRTARDRAERGGDVSNLRQIGTALLAFAGENQNRFPAAAGRIGWGETSPVTGLGSWTEQILPYLGGNTNVFRSRTAP